MYEGLSASAAAVLPSLKEGDVDDRPVIVDELEYNDFERKAVLVIGKCLMLLYK